MSARVASLSRGRSSLRLGEGAAIAAFAALTAVAAQIALRLPFSPVPITLQVLAVIASGFALGPRGGWASQVGYLAAGAVGLPVFAGGTGGLPVLLGPTAGYLVGFPAAAFVAGLLGQKIGKLGWGMRLVAGLCAASVIYVGGAVWLTAWLVAVDGGNLTSAISSAWLWGVRPFLVADLAKGIVASGVVDGARHLVGRLHG